MDIMQKLTILADAAKYDASCASSGSNRPNSGGLGVAAMGGICHSWAADGRCISLLKVLFTNHCEYDCAYCQNRKSNDIPRAAFTPAELAQLTREFYRRNYIEGLFLSSGVVKSPDHTMELLIRTLELVRGEGAFSGYIHVKAIPGASNALLMRLGELADRISVNIEMPSSTSLSLMAPDKDRDAITRPMGSIRERIARQEDERRFSHAPVFAPAGQSTQMIVGATGDSDRQIMLLSQGLYRKYRMRRVYYSAYIPINQGGNLPAITRPPLLREHRLYQSDWLIRLYGFKAEEVLPEDCPNLDPLLDPKAFWALRNLDRFPVEVNRAPYEELLRVPGVGMISAQRIVDARRVARIQPEQLSKLGVVMKRARHFLTADGKYCGVRLETEPVRSALVSADNAPPGLITQQMSFLEPVQDDWAALREAMKAISLPAPEGNRGLGGPGLAGASLAGAALAIPGPGGPGLTGSTFTGSA